MMVTYITAYLNQPVLNKVNLWSVFTVVCVPVGLSCPENTGIYNKLHVIPPVVRQPSFPGRSEENGSYSEWRALNCSHRSYCVQRSGCRFDRHPVCHPVQSLQGALQPGEGAGVRVRSGAAGQSAQVPANTLTPSSSWDQTKLSCSSLAPPLSGLNHTLRLQEGTNLETT